MDKFNLSDIITKDILLKMLQREEQLRFSQEYIDECTKVKNIPNGWLTVTSKLQERVANEFGFSDLLSNTIAVDMIRKAQYLYPDDKRFQETQVYVRNNLAKEGHLKKNDLFPSFELFGLNLKSINSNILLNSNKPNIIIASSHT